MDPVTAALSHPLAALLIGIAANFATTMKDRADSGKRIMPWAWCKANPYRAALAVGGSLAGYGALAGMGQLNFVAALGAGYAGSDLLDAMAQGAARKVKQAARGG